MAGEIESVGKDVTRFKKGDQVFGSTGMALGGYAEYVCLPEEGILATIPANISFEEAAAVPVGGLEALHFLKIGKIKPGQKILINGAGGSIGSFGVQLAKHFGAEVTAVDSEKKFKMLRSIGADHVIDYTKEDFSKSDETYDVIFDVVGKSPFSASLRSLRKNGFYLIANPKLVHKLRGPWASLTSGRKVTSTMARHNLEDLNFLKELMEAGTIKTVIDRRYPLEQVPEAHRYAETGQKAGNIVINVIHDNQA